MIVNYGIKLIRVGHFGLLSNQANAFNLIQCFGADLLLHQGVHQTVVPHLSTMNWSYQLWNQDLLPIKINGTNSNLNHILLSSHLFENQRQNETALKISISHKNKSLCIDNRKVKNQIQDLKPWIHLTINTSQWESLHIIDKQTIQVFPFLCKVLYIIQTDSDRIIHYDYLCRVESMTTN